jgi:predicted secreted protein
MTTQIEATPFIALAVRGHRKRIGKEVRVLLSSTTVDVTTKETLAAWKEQTGRNLGGVLDATVSFAKSRGFPRTSDKKTASVRSTGPDAAQLPKSRSVRAEA